MVPAVPAPSWIERAGWEFLRGGLRTQVKRHEALMTERLLLYGLVSANQTRLCNAAYWITFTRHPFL
jgi:hypothetical protein